MKFYKIFMIGVLLIFFSSLLCAQTPDSLIMKINESTYKIDNIKIDIANREITFPAEFNMNRGLIETILVGPQGRLHETILKTDALPAYIQTSLLLLGLECGQNMELGNYNTVPEGDSLLVYAIWTDTSRSHTRRTGRAFSMEYSSETGDAENALDISRLKDR